MREHGLGRDEVRSLRAYFRSYLDAYAAEQPIREGESEEERSIRLEEEWIGTQGAGSELAINTNLVRSANNTTTTRLIRPSRATLEISDTDSIDGDLSTSIQARREFMWGFIMGFCLSYIMLFWLWERSMTHYQKMGILSGVSLRLGWEILNREKYNAEHSKELTTEE